MWSGWGFAVILLGLWLLLGGVFIGDALIAYLALPYGPAQSAGFLISGASASLSIAWIAKWREGKPGRTLIDDKTGERFNIGANAGDLLLIPVRYWSWVFLALTAFWTVILFDAPEPPPSGY